MRRVTAALAFAIPLLLGREARAFCGFYVGGAGAKLFNNATQVVLMREGTRTVLSMANNYQGPPESFAMVVPVPIVLQKENVKTLPREVFEHIDQLTAPRLVEYWEQDPCPPEMGLGFGRGMMAPAAKGALGGSAAGSVETRRPTVKIEAQFTVGEYEIVILSAEDAMGLDTWLREHKYNIPEGAEAVLRPYVQGGMKFFVAKVDMDRVRKDGDRTMLSPLRFHYDTELFSLPIRLGLLNSSGTQDLIVNVLAPGKRYEVANYKNIAIPTNLNVKNPVKQEFGSFYAALFDQTLKKHPGAVVTEYSWDASSCDPCPGPPLSAPELVSLGADQIATQPPPGRGRRNGAFVLTRLHARYTRDSLGEDLVFREAKPIVGGREHTVDDSGLLEQGAQSGSINNFQARYAIRYPWMGPITCKNPQRGVWGDPPDGGGGEHLFPATNLAFVPRKNFDPWPLIKTNRPVEASLLGAAEKVSSTIPTGLALLAPPPPSASVAPADPGPPVEPPPAPSAAPSAEPPSPPAGPPRGGCAGCEVSPAASSLPALLALGAAMLLRLRRRTR
jgi:hypothetical protein